MTDDNELPPCVGEAMADVLAERAIATLADWENGMNDNVMALETLRAWIQGDECADTPTETLVAAIDAAIRERDGLQHQVRWYRGVEARIRRHLGPFNNPTGRLEWCVQCVIDAYGEAENARQDAEAERDELRAQAAASATEARGWFVRMDFVERKLAKAEDALATLRGTINDAPSAHIFENAHGEIEGEFSPGCHALCDGDVLLVRADADA